MATLSSKAERNDEYTLVQRLSEGNFLVRRNIDGELLLGQAFDVARWPDMAHLKALMDRGAGVALGNVLNHENLISIASSLRHFNFLGLGPSPATNILLWDFCDAGTLDALFREPPVRNTRTGWLPESLCWHVLISLLKALAWLHDGYRAGYRISPAQVLQLNPDYGRVKGAPQTAYVNVLRERYHEWVADPDWMPILHRNIRPENVYFQQPRGKETYGLCKLGNYGDCYVSGHVNALSQGCVVATKETEPLLEEMKERMAVENIYDLEKQKRPYTRGSELFAVGAMLYRMMTSHMLPDPEECNLCGCRHMDDDDKCTHGCHLDIDLDDPLKKATDYTDKLRDFVKELLTLNRSDLESAALKLDRALEGFINWKENTADGRLYVELDDDLEERERNLREKARHEAKEAGYMAVGVV